MALKATLMINGRFYNVQDLSYRLTQPSDQKGRPVGLTGGGVINFTILANRSDNNFFEDWVLSIANVESGKFILPITEGVLHLPKMIEFKDAYCTDLQVNYSTVNEKQMFLKLSISPTRIIFREGLEYVNTNLDRS
jgi:hypothetical protein